MLANLQFEVVSTRLVEKLNTLSRLRSMPISSDPCRPLWQTAIVIHNSKGGVLGAPGNFRERGRDLSELRSSFGVQNLIFRPRPRWSRPHPGSTAGPRPFPVGLSGKSQFWDFLPQNEQFPL